MSTRLLYSIEQTAYELGGISVSIVKKLISDGELSSTKIGRRRLVPHDALTTYIARIKDAS